METTIIGYTGFKVFNPKNLKLRFSRKGEAFQGPSRRRRYHDDADEPSAWTTNRDASH